MGNTRKRGGKRKIPILAQDTMPIYETSKSEDLSELDASISSEFRESLLTQAPNTLLSSEGVLLPLLKKRATIPSQNAEDRAQQMSSSTASGPNSTSADQDEDDEGFFNEDVSALLGSIYSGGGDSQERIRAKIDAAKERLRLAFPLLTPQQRERYEKFRQSAIPRPVMKRVHIRLIYPFSGCSPFWEPPSIPI